MSRCAGVVLVSLLAIASLSSTTQSQQQQSPEFAVVIMMPIPNLTEKWLPLTRVGEPFFERTTTDKLRRLYGRPKPALDDEIFVSSSTGRLAEIAAQKLMRMGYTRQGTDQPQYTNSGKVIISLCPPEEQFDSEYNPSSNNLRISGFDGTIGPTTLDYGIIPTSNNILLQETFPEQPKEDDNFRRIFGRATPEQYEASRRPGRRSDISDQHNRLDLTGRDVDHTRSTIQQSSNTEKVQDDDVIHFQVPYSQVHDTSSSTTLPVQTPAPIGTKEVVSDLPHNAEELLEIGLHPTSNNGPGHIVSRFDDAVSTTTLSSSPHQAPVATFEEVLALPLNPRKLLVGVRTPKELLDTGEIPTSINVPLPRVAEMFSNKTTAEQFRELYGRDKPALDDEIIVTCRTGRRAEIAAQQLMRLGYTSVKNYRGSWSEWATRNGLPPQ